MIYKNLSKFIYGVSILKRSRDAVHYSLMLSCFNYSRESREEVLPLEWYEKAYPTLTKLAHQLYNVDLVDGKLVNANDGSVIINDRILSKMHTFKSLVRVFIGSPVVQRNIKESIKLLSVDVKCETIGCFSKTSERQPMIVNSLTKVGDLLNVSAQQRKVVRHTICQQVTQHRIWTGALVEILNGLRSELNDFMCDEYAGKGKNINMGQQIISSCLKFLADVDGSENGCASWMQIRTPKSGHSLGSGTWEDLLEMFNDLIAWLDSEKASLYHFAKLQAMKEGLSQIKHVLVDKSIGYKEVRHQESLVEKKLFETLGHSSHCLFTLLMYYLYGYIRNVEVDLYGGIYGGSNDTRFCLFMGRILTSDEEKMVWSGAKQLYRALELFKFVWETAEMKGVLELQGHLWCVGAKSRVLTYRGILFFVHDISL